MPRGALRAATPRPFRAPLPLAVVLTLVALLGAGCGGARGRGGVSASGGGGSPPDLRLAEADITNEPRTVGAAEALADLEVALYAFRNAYAGAFGGKGTPRGEAIEAARARIAGRPGWSPADFAELLRD